MFSNIKDLGIWKRYVIIILFTIVISFSINKILFLPIVTMADNNAWLQYWGNVIGALVAGLVTLWGIETTIKSTLMNVKPLIKPINTEFYIYHNSEGNYVMTDKSFLHLIEEYYRNIEIEIDEYKMLIVDVLYEKVVNERENNRWQKDIENVDFENFRSEITKVHKYQNGENAFSNLDRDADKLDDTGYSYNGKAIKEIFHDIRETCIERIADRVFFEEKMRGIYPNIVVPVYNVGAGNAVDVSFNWTFKENCYKKILDKIGFNDKDYERLNRGLSLTNINPFSTDILLNMNGENKMHLPLAYQLANLVKHIFVKKLDNRNANVVINDDLSVNYSRIADLHIECKDVYGDPSENSYKVLFKMIDDIGEEYGYKKTHINLKFEEC
ncbi:MAG: hypothetical protein ACOX0L_00410 [Natronincolaceae bacterium]|jgi:hypothetical protein|nr:hypothetical protein [Bacillota bacterium]NLK90071.1 hypothetical protein [Clostridiales bacterium]